MTQDYEVEVCSACLCASCWHGESMCQEAQGAGTTMRKASELDAMHREHPCYYSMERLMEMTGHEPETVTP